MSSFKFIRSPLKLNKFASTLLCYQNQKYGKNIEIAKKICKIPRENYPVRKVACVVKHFICIRYIFKWTFSPLETCLNLISLNLFWNGHPGLWFILIGLVHVGPCADNSFFLGCLMCMTLFPWFQFSLFSSPFPNHTFSMNNKLRSNWSRHPIKQKTF